MRERGLEPRQGNQRKRSIATMLREVVVILKEEQACFKVWFEDKSVNEDVRRGIEISLTKISETLGKLAALEKGSAAEESYAGPTEDS
jgi:hypothetical protein